MIVTLPTQELLDRLAPVVGDDVQLHLWTMEGPSGLGHVDLAVMPYMAPASTLAVLEGEDVAAVQSQALGYDKVADVLPDGVAFANAVGVHEAATAELTLAILLAAQRDVDTYVREAGQWNQRMSPGLVDRTVLVVGVGGVGDAIRARLEPFDCRILRSASRARTDEHGEVAGPDDLPRLVGEADVVVLATPLTEQTHHLFDATMIARMKPGALLVNIGRGPLVDTAALVEATAAGRIRAALDVVDPEPLPADHPLWTTPGVLVTPHVGGRSSTMVDRVVALLSRQVERLRRGEGIDHRVF